MNRNFFKRPDLGLNWYHDYYNSCQKFFAFINNKKIKRCTWNSFYYMIPTEIINNFMIKGLNYNFQEVTEHIYYGFDNDVTNQYWELWDDSDTELKQEEKKCDCSILNPCKECLIKMKEECRKEKGL